MSNSYNDTEWNSKISHEDEKDSDLSVKNHLSIQTFKKRYAAQFF